MEFVAIGLVVFVFCFSGLILTNLPQKRPKIRTKVANFAPNSYKTALFEVENRKKR